MLTPLSILSLDQGRIFRDEAVPAESEGTEAAAPAIADTEPVPQRSAGGGATRLLALLLRLAGGRGRPAHIRPIL